MAWLAEFVVPGGSAWCADEQMVQGEYKVGTVLLGSAGGCGDSSWFAWTVDALGVEGVVISDSYEDARAWFTTNRPFGATSGEISGTSLAEPKPTPTPAGVTVDLTFAGPHLSKHVVGFYPEATLTSCEWGSSPSDASIKYPDWISLTGTDIGVPALSSFTFRDHDGPGKSYGDLLVDVADGFDSFSYIWSPGYSAVPEWTKGTAKYTNSYRTVSFNLQVYDQLDEKKYMSVKGTVTCTP